MKVTSRVKRNANLVEFRDRALFVRPCARQSNDLYRCSWCKSPCILGKQLHCLLCPAEHKQILANRPPKPRKAIGGSVSAAMAIAISVSSKLREAPSEPVAPRSLWSLIVLQAFLAAILLSVMFISTGFLQSYFS